KISSAPNFKFKLAIKKSSLGDFFGSSFLLRISFQKLL
ncbi:hypothetical protein D058_08715, partial [Streptococcus pneumoniae 2009]